MKAFRGALGGWLLGQLVVWFCCAYLKLGWDWSSIFWGSLTWGGLLGCAGACFTAGSQPVSCGCIAYLLGWAGLIWLGHAVCTFVGLPIALVGISLIAGGLTGFWLMGDSPLSPVLLLGLLLLSFAYGLWALILPPPVLSLGNVAATLTFLTVAQVVHAIVARLLRGRSR